MKADEIRKLLVKELQANPELYEEAVVPGLIDSGLRSSEIVSVYLESIGVEISKTQESRLFKHDMFKEKAAKQAKKKEEAIKAETEKRLAEWAAKGSRVYSVDDFPEWIYERVGGDKDKTERIVNETVEEIIRKSKSAFTVHTRDIPEQFMFMDGKAVFSEKGYEYLIMQSRANDWVGLQGQKRWSEESGVCKTFKCFAETPQLGSNPAK